MEGRIWDVCVRNPQKENFKLSWERKVKDHGIFCGGKEKPTQKSKTLQLIEMWYPMVVSYSIVRKKPGRTEPHFCPHDAQKSRAVCELSKSRPFVLVCSIHPPAWSVASDTSSLVAIR